MGMRWLGIPVTAYGILQSGFAGPQPSRISEQGTMSNGTLASRAGPSQKVVDEGFQHNSKPPWDELKTIAIGGDYVLMLNPWYPTAPRRSGPLYQC